MATVAKIKDDPPPSVGLARLREPFPPNLVSKLPKETKAQIDARKSREAGCMVWNCKECGGNHHKDATHLNYVGHAALTDRLLDADPEWSWEPVALDERGLPAFDQTGGLWIKLTVCGVTRLGYGHAAGKSYADIGSREKEVIGDALRNAAMRFGAALDLWHKGDLHADEEADEGHSKGECAVSPPASDLREQLEQSVEQTKPVRNWGGRYPTKTALKKAMHIHHAELERIGVEGTMDDLDEYLSCPEYQDYIKIAGEHHPLWLEGEIPAAAQETLPPEFIQTFALEQKARDMIAIRGNVPADVEG